MEKIFNIQTCNTHPNEKFEFYCFNDNTFLCSKCFKSHKKHDIEIIDDLKEKSKYIKLLTTKKLSLKEFYLNIKSELESVKSILDEQLQLISQDLQEDPEESNTTTSTTPDNIFLLSYQEYEKLNGLAEVLDKICIMSKTLYDLTKSFKSPMNLRIVNKEIKVIDKSKDNQNYPVDVMFDRNKKQKYTLFEGGKNNFITVDLGNKYFLQSIKMEFIQSDCSLKNFKVSIKNNNGGWNEVDNFCCDNFEKNNQIQSFNILNVAQVIRLDFIDTWGNKDGNYLLIKKIFFEIGDII